MVSKVVTLGALPAGLLLSSYGLYAVSDRGAKGDRLTPQQLSIYNVPPQGSRFVEAAPGRVQSVLSVLRKAVWPAVAWTQNACSSVRDGVEGTIQFGKDSYVYLKNPPPEFLPRVGVISVSGLAGLVLSKKGSRLKKVLYPLGLSALGASVCFPAQTVIFAKVTGKTLYSAGHRTYGAISSLWRTEPRKEEAITIGFEEVKEAPREDGSAAAEGSPAGHQEQDPREQHTQEQDPREPSTPLETPDISPIHPAEPNTTGVTTEQTKDVKFQPPPELVDHGQSNPEDKDLYSTRT